MTGLDGDGEERQKEKLGLATWVPMSEAMEILSRSVL